MRVVRAAFRWASGGAAAGSDRRCESGCGAHVPWVCASFAPGLNKTMLYARLLHSWTDNMRVINAPWDFDLAKVRSAVGGGAAENTRTRRMQRGRAAQRTRGVPSTRALYVAWYTCCTPHNVRMPYTFFSTSPERIWTPRAALVCASLQVASLRGPGRVVVTTAPDDTTNPPPMQKCAHECRYIAVYVVLVADVGLVQVGRGSHSWRRAARAAAWVGPCALLHSRGRLVVLRRSSTPLRLLRALGWPLGIDQSATGA